MGGLNNVAVQRLKKTWAVSKNIFCFFPYCFSDLLLKYSGIA
jgi:hypothetical protein